MSEKKASQRTRNYATVIYLDSAPEKWMEIIESWKVPVFVSPYHDRDIIPDGTPKKPHYHIMVMFDNVKTKEQANELFESVNGVGCEVVNSLRGMARYLCHLDNPDKAQYRIEDVKQFGGADYLLVIGTAADKAKMIREMRDFVNENDIDYYCDLFDYACEQNSMWFDCLINNGSYTMKEYIKSRTFKKQHKLEKDSFNESLFGKYLQKQLNKLKDYEGEQV